MSAHINSRRYDLDWLRIIAFGLLIFYHIGMFYVSWGWHVKSVHAGPAAEPLMRILNPWRLSLLFFISGLAIRFAVDKLGSVMLARTRIVQLLVPIIFGMMVIVMPQAYFQLIESGEITMSVTEFYPQYLDFGSDFSITTPTWNHLWYIVYLLVYVLLLAPVAP
ncbi:MAG: acyltransferase family protein, partial [Hyphomonadaceae bacterium]